MDNKRGKRAFLNQRKLLLGCSLIIVCLVIGISYLVYAKYYAVKSNKGVATASGLYFSSNLLKQMNNDTDYQGVYNNESWNGSGTFRFDLQIRNYENDLLYNDENLNIVYKITFELQGEDDGYTYKVGKSEGDLANLSTEKTVQYDNIVLSGGEKTENHFTVSVTAPDGAASTFTSRGIKVTATPVSPDYVVNKKELGGILYATTVVGTYEMNYSFDIEDTLSGQTSFTEDDKKSIDSYSGLPWKLTTTGDTQSKTRRVKIKSSIVNRDATPLTSTEF